MIDFQTTEDERLLWDAAARFGEDHLRPAEREHERARCYPVALREAYTDLGFAGLGLPEDLGGAGLDASQRVGAYFELAGADSTAPLGLSVAGPGAFALATTPAGREVLDRPGAVVHARGLRIEDGRASGTIDWLPCQPGIAWLALADSSGVYLVRDPQVVSNARRACGLHAAGGIRVTLDGARCETLGGPDLAREVLAECRAFASAVMLGAASDAHSAAAKYSQERIAFGKPIAHHQGLAFQLVDCATDLMGARLLLEAAVAAGCARRIANAHAYACEVAQHVAERSVQVLGGHGYLYDHRVEKRMRDIRGLASLYGGAIASSVDAGDTILELGHPLEVE